MKRTSIILVLVLCLSAFSLSVTLFPENSEAKILYVGGIGANNYSKIQTAIFASDSGDTIYVHSGTYHESLLVDKSLSIHGEEKNTTIIDGDEMVNVVKITSGQVDIRDFTIMRPNPDGSHSAILLDSATNCVISDNIISDSRLGISLSYSDMNIIAGNNISTYGQGIGIQGSKRNEIRNNTLTSNLGSGINVRESQFITISNNTITDSLSGISLVESDNNMIVDNTIFSDMSAITIRYSVSNTLARNDIVGSGFGVDGYSPEHWNTHDVNVSNTVNGKPIYYWINVVVGTVPPGAGQVILVECRDVRIDNQNLSNVISGIAVVYSSNVTISNSNVSSNTADGIYLLHANNTDIYNTNSSFNQHGVWGTGCANISISNGVLSWNQGRGIHLGDSSGIFSNNTVFSNGAPGMFLSISWSTVSGNTVYENRGGNYRFGIIVRGSNNTVVNNNASSNHGSGITVVGADNSLVNNIASDNWYSGFGVDYFDRGLIADNVANYNGDGISISGSDDVDVVNNTVSWNYYSGATRRRGIALLGTASVALSNNIMVGNGVYVEGGSIDEWNSHTIDISNTVNGKPVYYWKDAIGGTIPLGAGQVILANCTRVIVENQNLDNSTVGVELGFSSRITVANNTASNGWFGIDAYKSHNNTLVNNTVLATNMTGIRLFLSDDNVVDGNNVSSGYDAIRVRVSRNNLIANNNVSSSWMGVFTYVATSNNITGNTASYNSIGILVQGEDNVVADNLISDNSGSGLVMEEAHFCTIFNNTISRNMEGLSLSDSDNNAIIVNTVSRNEVGVHLHDSYDNRIYHNQFLNNTEQVDTWSLYKNNWDDGYPSGGNYWSDYTGIDIQSGAYQNLPGSDGIGDTPYFIDSTNVDNYPLMIFALSQPFRQPTISQAVLSGNSFEDVAITWSLSPDDGAGLQSVTGYRVYRGNIYNLIGTGYQLVDTLPNGTFEFTDSLVGEGDPSNYFYVVCAVDMNNRTMCAIDQAAKYTRYLSQGLQLGSIPLIQSDETLGTVLQTVSFDKAWFYDSLNKDWVSVIGSKPYSSGLNSANHAMGFWVNLSISSNLTVAGLVPHNTTIYLRQGWNLVGFPSFNTTYTVGNLKAQTSAGRVEGFDPLSSPYFLKKLGNSELMKPGYGYWVWVDADTTWTVPGF